MVTDQSGNSAERQSGECLHSPVRSIVPVPNQTKTCFRRVPEQDEYLALTYTGNWGELDDHLVIATLPDGKHFPLAQLQTGYWDVDADEALEVITPQEAQRYGEMFAAAPKLLAALKLFVADFDMRWDYIDRELNNVFVCKTCDHAQRLPQNRDNPLFCNNPECRLFIARAALSYLIGDAA